MRILVTGSKGQLGSDVVERCKKTGIDVLSMNRTDTDITDESAVKEYIRNSGADAVIHCAAYTAVDKAEDEKELCHTVNVNGTAYVAQSCKELNIKMIYISTDYVFDGKGSSPCTVSDQPKPINYYGQSKYLGEQEVLERVEKSFIVRTSWVFGKNGNNFVKTMLRLACSKDPITGRLRDHIDVVNDQIGSPTYTWDLARLLCDMIQTEQYGIYHATNEGFCSWYEFACEIFRIAEVDIAVNPIPSSAFSAKAVRPMNSRMDKSKLSANGFIGLQSWQAALQDFMSKNQSICDGGNTK